MSKLVREFENEVNTVKGPKYRYAIGGASLLLNLLFAEAAVADSSEEKKHNFMVRLRGTWVNPVVDSDDVPLVPNAGGVPGPKVFIKNYVIPEIDVTYFIDNNMHFAAEMILGTTKHRMQCANTVFGKISLGSVWLLPATVTLQYHALPNYCVDPYIGLGVNYTIFYHSKHGPVATKVSYRDTLSYAFQLGVDFKIVKNWYFNIDYKKIFIHTRARVRGIGGINGGIPAVNVKINPNVLSVGIGYRF